MIAAAAAAAAAVVVASLGGGCSGGSGGGGDRSRGVAIDPLAPPRKCPPPVVAAAGFRHHRNGILTRALAPHHAATDVVAAGGAPFVVGGKLTYGPTSKDLQGEEVAVYLADATCAMVEIGRAITDDDGRIGVPAPAQNPGVYSLWLAVLGDGTVTDATAWIIPVGQRGVIFDVDGTLTTGDGELIEELAGGAADMALDADRVARHWAERGYLVVYLTGRPYLLRASTRAWLDLHEFPPGPVLTSDRVRDAMPGGSVLGFKTDAVRNLLAAGLEPVRAYGNAVTDVCAYARAGIAPDHTFIVQAAAESALRCDDHPPSMPLNSYTDHLRELGSSQDAR